MPEDPREASSGHHRSRSDWTRPEDEAGESGNQAAGRRRRALGDDGTGGTRVMDLLSKHGKSAAGSGSHRRSAERAAEEQDAPEGQSPSEAGAEQQAPPRGRSATSDPSGRQNPQAGGPPQRGGSRHATPPQAESRHSNGAAPNPADPGTAAPTGGEPNPRSARQPNPPTGASPDQRTRQRPQDGDQQQPPRRRRSRSEQQPGSPSAPQRPDQAATQHGPRRPSNGGGPRDGGEQAPTNAPASTPDSDNTTQIPPVRTTPRRPNGPKPPRGSDAPSGPEADGRASQTRVGPPPGAVPQAPAAGSPPATPGPGSNPVANGYARPETGGPAEQSRPPEPPGNTGAEQQRTRITEALGAGGGRPVADDEPATAQQAAVPAAPARSEPDVSDEADPESAKSRRVGDKSDPPAMEPEESDQDDPHDSADEAAPDGQDRTSAIDATLARFSAVHDEIAAEEARRRKRYAWLPGKRKEPEPGQDMPFDFTENRAGASRVEWRKYQRRRRAVLAGKTMAVAAAIAVFVATGIGWSAQTWLDSKFRQVAALDTSSDAIQNGQMQHGDLNFLLIGSDTRKVAAKGDNIGSLKSTPGARSDTTMIAHIPEDRSRVVIVSFPRDLEVDVPECAKWNAKSGEYTDEMAGGMENAKFNAAYAAGGPKCTTKVVQRISGLRITNFLGINFHGFSSMVRAVDGVRICTNKPVIDSVLGPILTTAGWHKLNGEQALKYVRARHVKDDPTADYGRMERQQLFLSALLRKTMSANVLLDPAKLTDFVSAVANNTFGENIGTDQLMALARSLQGLDPDKVTFITVPTTGEANENGNEELRESAAHALFRAIIEGTPISEPEKNEESGDSRSAAGTSPMAYGASARYAPASPKQSVSPGDVDVRVFNTTTRAGLAGETADKLRAEGYGVSGVGNLESDSEHTIIRYSADLADQARLLSTSLPNAQLVQDDSAGGAVHLELGSGFDGVVQQPNTGKPDIPDNLATVNAGEDRCGGV